MAKPCRSGKLPYWSMADADEDVARINQQNRRMSYLPVHAYMCPECGLWHVGRSSAALKPKVSPNA